MPFVTIDGIKPFISASLYTALNKEYETGKKNFDKIEAEAAIIIRDTAFIDIPENAAAAPDWIKYPAALIIQKLGSRLLVELTPEYSKSVDADYDRALNMLKDHIEDPSEDSTSTTGTIEGLYEW